MNNFYLTLQALLTDRIISGAASIQERPYEWGWGMHPMMWGAWGFGMMLMMVFFWVLMIVGIVLLVRWLLGHGRDHRDSALKSYGRDMRAERSTRMNSMQKEKTSAVKEGGQHEY